MKFSLSEKPTDVGTIPDPIIPVSVKTCLGYKEFLFLLDTGADFTMFPASFVPLLGLKRSNLPRTKSYGIEGNGLDVFIAPVTLRIGRISFEAMAFLSTNESTPLILGRQGLFDRFNIHFDNRRKIIRISPL